MKTKTKIAGVLRLTAVLLVLSNFFKPLPPEITVPVVVALVIDSWSFLYCCLTR